MKLSDVLTDGKYLNFRMDEGMKDFFKGAGIGLAMTGAVGAATVPLMKNRDVDTPKEIVQNVNGFKSKGEEAVYRHLKKQEQSHPYKTSDFKIKKVGDREDGSETYSFSYVTDVGGIPEKRTGQILYMPWNNQVLQTGRTQVESFDPFEK